MHRVRNVVVVLAFLFLAGILGCTSTSTPLPIEVVSTSAPLPTVVTPIPYSGECTPLPQPALLPTSDQGDGLVRENQIIIIGIRDEIENTVTTTVKMLKEKAPELFGDLELVPLAEIDLSFLDECSAGAGSTSVVSNTRVIRLYEDKSRVITTLAEDKADERLRALIEAINGNASSKNSLSSKESLHAERNYLIGDPGCVEGGPAGESTVAGQNLFWDQWAFKENGLGPFTVQHYGEGIRIGIFDTSPFDEEGGWTIPWIVSRKKSSSKLNICVSHPGPVLPLESPNTFDARDHGLFVASLVYALAPDSEIHLIRVLNGENKGDVYTLINALVEFIREPILEEGTLSGTVINLSLGIQSPDSKDTESLSDVLQAAHDCGAVIVASAGNNSKPENPQTAQFPASLSVVLGVEASNYYSNKACFSNDIVDDNGVAAPGGDFGSNCESKVTDCAEEPEYCLVGLSMHTSSETGYIYWAGTSFSAPLVSGLATLVLDALIDRGPDGELADCVSEIIRYTAEGRGGIIHVPGTLVGASCPTSISAPTPIPTPTS